MNGIERTAAATMDDFGYFVIIVNTRVEVALVKTAAVLNNPTNNDIFDDLTLDTQ